MRDDPPPRSFRNNPKVSAVFLGAWLMVMCWAYFVDHSPGGVLVGAFLAGVEAINLKFDLRWEAQRQLEEQHD